MLVSARTNNRIRLDPDGQWTEPTIPDYECASNLVGRELPRSSDLSSEDLKALREILGSLSANGFALVVTG
ncbi:MAG: hypothetical protein ABIF89_01925 [bacterium]